MPNLSCGLWAVTGVILAQQLNVVPQGVVCTPDESKRGRRTLMIDNYDSFTWNLYQYLSQLGQEVIVHRNDKITLEECLALAPDRLVISPGTVWPKDAGVSSTQPRRNLARTIVLTVVCVVCVVCSLQASCSERWRARSRSWACVWATSVWWRSTAA